MTVYLAWTDQVVDDAVAGPWSELRTAAPGVLFIDSTETLSRVYHELKWSLAPGAALLVAPLAGLPKLKGLRPGSLVWLRARRNDL